MVRELLTRDQAHNAIYLDFEGFEDKPAALLGWLSGQFPQPTASDVTQTVLDGTYELTARHSGLPVGELSSTIDQLVTEASRDGRLLASYSSSDSDVVKKHADPGVADRFAAIYFNALPFATWWANALHDEWHIPNPRTKGKVRYSLHRFLSRTPGRHLYRRRALRRTVPAR